MINAALAAANEKRFSVAKITRGPEFALVAKKLVAAKARYVTVQNTTGVPWFIIAVIHEREADQRWDTHLGQGDPLNQVTRHVPVGEPAFATWEEGAIDALVKCAPYAARNKDWSVGGSLATLEGYNGLAYFNHGVPSPYIWSGTNQYTIGKVIVDHGPIEPVVDKQLGCAGLIMAMMELDASIKFGAKIVTTPVKTGPIKVKPSTPSFTNPAPGSIGEFIGSIFSAIFKRKG
jgi:lysozyme family protein